MREGPNRTEETIFLTVFCQKMLAFNYLAQASVDADELFQKCFYRWNLRLAVGAEGATYTIH
jgi:hypothetical protein